MMMEQVPVVQQQQAADDAGTGDAATTSLPWMRNALERLDPKMYLYEFLQQGTRPDGRCFHQARPTRLVKGILGRKGSSTIGAASGAITTTSSSNIAGSAMVHLGSTVVLAAVTLQVGQPMAGCHPEWGDVVVQMETSSSSNATTSGNNNSNYSNTTFIQLAQWVQGRILESHMMDLSQLCLIPGHAAWRLHITMLLLQSDGNVRDASLLAAVAALLDTKLPATQILHNMATGGGGSTTTNNTTTTSSSSNITTQPQQRAVVNILVDQPSHPLIISTFNIPSSLTLLLYHKEEEEERMDATTNTTTTAAATTKTLFLVDPTALEESMLTDRLMLVVKAQPLPSSSTTTTNSTAIATSTPPPDILHVSFHGAMDASLLVTAWHLAKGRAQELQELLL